MRKLVYYVAVTLDGHIAGPDGQFDFFPFEGDVRDMILTELPETLPVHARGPFGLAGVPNRRFDAVIMGRGTYEPALRLGIVSPYPHLDQYVVSRTLTGGEPGPAFVAEDPVGLVQDLKNRDGLDIWLAGGGKLAAALRDEIDELVLKRSPIFTGSGIPLFDGPFTPTVLRPVASQDFEVGVNITTYVRAGR